MAVHAKITNCCFCITLKAGVIIISLVWLIYGIVETLQNSLIFVSLNKGLKGPNVYGYTAFAIPITICYGLITIGAAFGLFAVTFSNKPKILSIYVGVAYFIAGAEIIARVLTIVFIIMYRPNFLKECADSIYATSSRIEYSGDACNQGYIFSLTFAIAFAIITILFTLYYAMVVASYVYHERKGKNKMDADIKYSDDETNDNLLSN